MAKPSARRVPSDDCEVTIDEVTYKIHEGEWVEVLPGLSVGDYSALHAFTSVKTQMDAVKGEENEGQQVLGILAQTFDAAIPIIASRLLAWTWTDPRGRPYPPPDSEPSPLRRLGEAEVAYLIQVIMGTNPAAQQSFTQPSGTTSSDIPSLPRGSETEPSTDPSPTPEY